jgi:hypothetical protein
MPQFEEILEPVLQQIVAANVMMSKQLRDASSSIANNIMDQIAGESPSHREQDSYRLAP